MRLSKHGLGLNLKEEEGTGRAFVDSFRTLPGNTPNPCLACLPPLQVNDTIVGVNSAAYGFGYVAVTPDLRTYKTPADAFANLTEEWNTHFTLDVLKNLGEYLDADLKASAAKNGPTDLSTGGHFLGINGTAKETDLTQESVTAMVAKWPGGTGVGLGFIADRYSKVDELGCYWPAFYNMESHAVIWTARMCEEPSGAGYRNYWLGTAKRVAADLEDVRKKNW